MPQTPASYMFDARGACGFGGRYTGVCLALRRLSTTGFRGTIEAGDAARRRKSDCERSATSFLRSISSSSSPPSLDYAGLEKSAFSFDMGPGFDASTLPGEFAPPARRHPPRLPKGVRLAKKLPHHGLPTAAPAWTPDVREPDPDLLLDTICGTRLSNSFSHPSSALARLPSSKGGKMPTKRVEPSKRA